MSNIIEYNVNSVRDRIATAAEKAGRKENDILLVAVSKMQPLDKIYQAHQAGLRHFGENKVQDLSKKIGESEIDLTWHMVGHLQSNKVNKVIGKVEMIQSVDSEHLLGKVEKSGQERDISTKILLQVNTSGEISKFGFKPESVESVCELAENLTHTQIQGLMTIGPFTDDLSRIITSFRSLRKLAEKLGKYRSSKINMDYLSMGMTGDFEIAIEEGSNLVRIGTAIFGPRI